MYTHTFTGSDTLPLNIGQVNSYRCSAMRIRIEWRIDYTLKLYCVTWWLLLLTLWAWRRIFVPVNIKYTFLLPDVFVSSAIIFKYFFLLIPYMRIFVKKLGLFRSTATDYVIWTFQSLKWLVPNDKFESVHSSSLRDANISNELKAMKTAKIDWRTIYGQCFSG